MGRDVFAVGSTERTVRASVVNIEGSFYRFSERDQLVTDDKDEGFTYNDDSQPDPKSHPRP